MRTIARGFLTLILLTFGLASLATPGVYDAEVRHTSHGIPHIKAADWGGLGYGYGYAFASQNLCVLAREVVAANGQLSRYFGESSGNLTNDFFYTLVNNEAFILAGLASLEADSRAAIKGYAAGYSRYLRDTGVDNLPLDCRSEPWVREIDEIDLGRVFYKLILRASGGPLSSLIVDARPPGTRHTGATKPRHSKALSDKIKGADFSQLRDMINVEDLGSNMYGLGANATQSGRGILLGNPHFPWNGSLRWFQVHLTIPGEVDVMGSSLHGIPLVNIGFNDNFAWSHTVSSSDRFTLFELPLVPGNPNRYLFDGVEQDFETDTVSIDVLVNGQLETRQHTFYSTVHGLVLDFNALFGFYFWDTGLSVFSLGDANAGNWRAVDQILRMDRSQDLNEFITSLRTTVGLPWVHTIAADRNGTAFYGDMTVVPNVSDAKIAACPPLNFGNAIIAQAGLIVLDGGRSECQWDVDPSAPVAGILGTNSLPQITTQDYVTNSNDNHWLTNPDQPLTGFVPTLLSEETERTMRTRLGLVQVRERLDGSDGQGAPGYTVPLVQSALFDSRSYLAELIADELVQVCMADGPMVDLDGDMIDVSQACTVLNNWDRKQNNESVGAHIFLEFARSANAELSNYPADLFEVPFDVSDPVNTPRDLLATTAPDRANVMRWLAQGVQRLNDFGLSMTATWGELQYSDRNGTLIPIHGGPNTTGSFSIINSSLGVDGYTPISSGNSYMQTVTFDEDGPIADALLSYSQSSDPASPFYADQTQLYSDKIWVRLPFKEADILADPNYSTFTLTETFDEDADGVDDDVDNCTLVSNTDQRDTNGDGYGNACDADLNNDDIINAIDLGLFKAVFFDLGDLDADFNGDGVVNAIDLGVLKLGFFMAPGPSGLNP